MARPSKGRDRQPRSGKEPPGRRTRPTPLPAESWSTLALAAACGTAAFGLYALTAARDIVLGDSAEFVTVAATLGVAHPPGYPILTLLGHLFTLLGPGSIPFRANLLSVTAGAGTVAFTFLTTYRITRDRMASGSAALLLAVQPVFWEWSLVLEAFALGALLASATLYALLRWDEQPRQIHWLAWALACAGLGAANHHTMVFLGPSLALALWRHRAIFTERPALALVALAAVPGLASYLYLPWSAATDPILNWGNISSLSGLIDHILRTTYGTFQLSDTAQTSSPLGDHLAVFAGSFTIAEALMASVGLVIAMRSRTADVWIFGLSAVLAGPVFVGLSNLNVGIPGYAWVLRRFCVLPHVLMAPFVGRTLAAAAQLLNRRGALETRTGQRGPALAVAALVAALLIVGIGTDYPRLDQRNNHLASQFADDILATVPPNAVLLAGSDVVTLPVTYVQAIEGRRPDVTLVMFGPLARGDWYIPELRARDPHLRIPFDHYDPSQAASMRALVDANPGRPFALVGAPPDSSLEPDYWFLPQGLTLRLERRSQEVPLADMDAQNDRLFRAYRLPSPAVGEHSNFDPYVLRAYATGARQVGLQYLASQRPTDAAIWFRRALAIDPSDDTSRSLLSQTGSR